MTYISPSKLAAVLLAGTSIPALAQSAGDAAAPQSGLEEIIVTATKRAENLQNVPVAITAITSSALSNQGAFETIDLNHIMPNLQVNSSYGSQQPNFTLRGIGVGTEYNANAASPVGVYVDEVYQTFRSSHGQQLFDLDRIEVVKGPQGTLYGRNTTGGAVNFYTRRPDLRGENGYVTASYGNYNRRSFEGGLEITPIEGVLGIRVAGSFVDTDPWMRNRLATGINLTSPAITQPYGNLNTGIDPGGLRTYAYRGTVRFAPNDGLDITLKGYASKAEGGVAAPISTGVTPGTDTISLRTTAFAGLYTPALTPFLPADYSRAANGLNAQEIQSDTLGKAVSRAEGVVLNVSAHLAENLKLVSITGYDSGRYLQSQTDCDGTPYRTCSTGYSSHFKAFNQDLRVDFQSGPLKMILGAYYGWDRIVSDNTPQSFLFLRDVTKQLGLPPTYFNPGGALLPTSLPTGISATQHYVQTRTSKALYGEAAFEIIPSVTLTGGLRYTVDHFSYTDALTTFYDDTGAPRLYAVSGYQVGGQFAPYLIGVSPGTASPLNNYASSKKFTGRAIADWKITDGVLAYASYSRGYRGGTFNGLAFQGAGQVYFVPPEKVDAFEVGLKSRFLDNRLQVNLAAFYYNYFGQQGQLVDQNATSNLVALDGKVTGFEAELEFAATDRLLLSAGLGLLDSKYNSGNCAGRTFAGPQSGNCLHAVNGSVIDVGGNPFPYAAKSSINMSFNWDAVDIGKGRLKLFGSAAYIGHYHYDLFGDYSKAPGLGSATLAAGGGNYWLLDSRISYVTDGWTLSVYGKNLTNKVYYPFGINIEGFFGSDYRTRGEPRMYGVEVAAKF
jgi:iron complex outermembrane receptor protein